MAAKSKILYLKVTPYTFNFVIWSLSTEKNTSFCSCCEEFLICTQTYSWRYLTLTLIDSTAFFLLSWYATLHMKVFCKQNKSHGFWFYYEIFWVFDSNSSRQWCTVELVTQIPFKFSNLILNFKSGWVQCFPFARAIITRTWLETLFDC